MRMATYKFRGCTIKSLGYYEPDHRVVWEATDENGDVVAHGYTLRECEFRILEDQVEARVRKECAAKQRKKRNCDAFSILKAEAEYQKIVGRPWNHDEDELACWLYEKAKEQ